MDHIWKTLPAAHHPGRFTMMAATSFSAEIDAKIAALVDWRGAILARVRKLILSAGPPVIEEIKWRKPTNPGGVAVWSHAGIICTGEIYKDKVNSPSPKVPHCPTHPACSTPAWTATPGAPLISARATISTNRPCKPSFALPPRSTPRDAKLSSHSPVPVSSQPGSGAIQGSARTAPMLTHRP
jgi:hypothetical protein